jgi:hypothetical protein
MRNFIVFKITICYWGDLMIDFEIGRDMYQAYGVEKLKQNMKNRDSLGDLIVDGRSISKLILINVDGCELQLSGSTKLILIIQNSLFPLKLIM